MTQTIRIAAFICLFTAAGTGIDPAHALDDPRNGRKLAERWCATCHLVTPDQKQAVADVPPFATLAHKSDEELEGLMAMLAAPHPAMPTLDLSRQDVADLAVYIRSLR